MLVTHDFAEAALLADEIAVIDRGRIVQRGPAAELSARPARRSSPTSPGAAVLFGTRAPRRRPGRPSVRLDGGGSVASTDAAEGAVGVAVYPWEITLEPAGHVGAHGSALTGSRPRSSR